MNEPLVSILMSAYNTEKYIDEAIESVLNQTYKNWELIICDDCSTDNSYILALKYKKKDKRIKVLKNKKNMRQAFSRNRAFKESAGKYIAIMDSDDRMDRKRLEKQVTFLENNSNYKFVCTNVIMFENNERINGYLIKKEYPNSMDVIRNKGFAYGTVMIDRNVFEEVGGYTISNITSTGEDYDLVCKLYSRGYRGANIPELLYEYRVVDAYRRRSYKAYLNEYKIAMSHVKKGWLKKNNLSYITIVFVFLPLLKGLIPQRIIKMYHQIKFRRSE